MSLPKPRIVVGSVELDSASASALRRIVRSQYAFDKRRVDDIRRLLDLLDGLDLAAPPAVEPEADPWAAEADRRLAQVK